MYKYLQVEDIIMKLSQILESHLQEYNDDYEARTDAAMDARIGMKGELLNTVIKDHYISVYDAIEKLEVNDQMWDQILAAFPKELNSGDHSMPDIEGVYIENDDVPAFSDLIVKTPAEAFKRFVKSKDDIMNSADMDEYMRDAAEDEEERKDPLGSRGLSRSDFM